jgi:hypothetical protein
MTGRHVRSHGDRVLGGQANRDIVEHAHIFLVRDLVMRRRRVLALRTSLLASEVPSFEPPELGITPGPLSGHLAT